VPAKLGETFGYAVTTGAVEPEAAAPPLTPARRLAAAFASA
jgi:hypothetical protein